MYELHMKEKHGPNPKKFDCIDCKRDFFTGSRLRKHLKTHLPDKEKLIFICDFCSKAFPTKGNLRTHFAHVHVRDSSFTCENCGKNFYTQGKFKEHQKSHSTGQFEKFMPN